MSTPTTNLYRIEVPIFATAYVMATSEAAARKVVCTEMPGLTCALADGGEVPVSGSPFNDERLPPMSLSPVATIASRGLLEKCQAELADETA